jgi:hypothetical protein
MEHWLNCGENVLLQWDSCLTRYKATLIIQLLSVFCFPATHKLAEISIHFIFFKQSCPKIPSHLYKKTFNIIIKDV